MSIQEIDSLFNSKEVEDVRLIINIFTKNERLLKEYYYTSKNSGVTWIINGSKALRPGNIKPSFDVCKCDTVFIYKSGSAFIYNTNGYIGWIDKLVIDVHLAFNKNSWVVEYEN